jgi:hypothetical protein
MDKQMFNDPLTQSVEYYLDFLGGISKELKDWLKELGAGRKISDRQFDPLQSFLVSLGRMLRSREEEKALFLFSNSETLSYFDTEKIRQERLNVIPGLFFKENGAFRPYVAQILPAIKAQAESDAEFRQKYGELVMRAGKKVSIAGRMMTYPYSSHSYPLELIAELEGIDVSLLVPDLLGFLYWGKDAYRTMCLLERGDKSKPVYRSIPKWSCGNHSYIPFIAYAVLKQGLDIIDAVFEGADFVAIARNLAYLFMRYDNEWPFYKNWLDKAIVQDFFQENPAPYRECNGSDLTPCEEDRATLFLDYLAESIKRSKPGTILAEIQLFFPCMAPAGNTDIADCLCYMERAEIAKDAYWRLVKLIVERAAACPVEDLLPLERFRDYRRGDSGRTGFYILEMYLKKIKPGRDASILLGRYICAVIENQGPGAPEEPLVWLLTRTGFASFCSEYLDNPDFLKDLLSATEACANVKYDWLNYVVTIWLLHNYRDRRPKPVCPPAAAEIEKQFAGGDEKNPISVARALLLSEGEFKPENVLLEGIWDFLSGEGKDIVIDQDFISCQYFVRASKDVEKVEALFREKLLCCAHELELMRHLKGNEKFNFSEFILSSDDADIIRTIPPEVFKSYNTTPGEMALPYLERHGDSLEKVRRIVSCYSGFEKTKDDNSCLSVFIEKATAETEDSVLALYTLLELYRANKECVAMLLEEQPEKHTLILNRCKLCLARLRKIPGTDMTAEERRDYYAVAFSAAYFVAEQVSCWSGLKPLLLALRHADRPLVGSGLQPLPESKENKGTNVAVEIGWFLRRSWGEDRLKALRRDMANCFSDYLKIRKKRTSAAAETRNGEHERHDSEHTLEGFSPDYVEPSPLWRYAYVRALDDLAVDSSGDGRPIHRTLHKAAEEDPSPEARKWAKQAENHLRNIRDGMEEGLHTRRLLQAFWWIRRAHLLTLQSPIDEKEALKTRNTEHRR